MTAVINFIQGIANGVGAAIEFLGGLIDDILTCVTYMTEAAAEMQTYIEFLPTSIVTIVVAMGGMTIIFMIVGRH